MGLIQLAIAIIIVCPVIMLLVTFFVFSKFSKKVAYSFGLAADVTTVVLFISVPLLFKSIWDLNVFLLVIIAAVLLAIVSTFFEWRKSKEIYIPQVMKRIWRLYFLILFVLYFILIFIGMVVYIARYIS